MSVFERTLVRAESCEVCEYGLWGADGVCGQFECAEVSAWGEEGVCDGGAGACDGADRDVQEGEDGV